MIGELTMEPGVMVTIRPVCRDDSQFLFSWANDEAVISGSFMRASPITWEQHEKWFHTRLTDPHCRLFIVVEPGGDRAGQVRVDIHQPVPGEGMVALGIAPDHRKRGYASEAIRLASQKVFEENDLQILHAYIRPYNEGSKRAFLNAGYTLHGERTYEGTNALYVCLSRYPS